MDTEAQQEEQEPVFIYIDEDSGARKTYPVSALSNPCKASLLQIQRLEERLLQLQLEAEDVQVALVQRKEGIKQRLTSDADAVIEAIDKH